MIKEYSLNFKEQKMDFKQYKDYVGDLSFPYRTVQVKVFGTGEKQKWDNLIKAFQLHIKKYQYDAKELLNES